MKPLSQTYPCRQMYVMFLLALKGKFPLRVNMHLQHNRGEEILRISMELIEPKTLTPRNVMHTAESKSSTLWSNVSAKSKPY